MAAARDARPVSPPRRPPSPAAAQRLALRALRHPPAPLGSAAAERPHLVQRRPRSAAPPAIAITPPGGNERCSAGRLPVARLRSAASGPLSRACLQAWHNGRWRHTLTEHRIAMALQLDRHGWLRPAPASPSCPRPTATRARRRAGVAAGAAQHQPAPGRFGGPEVAGLFLNRLDYGSHPWLERLRGLRVSAHLHPPRRRRDPVRVHRGPRLARRRVATRAGNAATTFPSASSWRAPTPALRRRPVPGPAPLRAARALPAGRRLGPRTHRPGRKTDPAGFQLDARARKAARRQLPPA